MPYTFRNENPRHTDTRKRGETIANNRSTFGLVSGSDGMPA
jgi:hypothetical protein